MLKKILLILAGVALCAAGVVTTYLIMNKAHKEETALLTAQISSLQLELDSIGDILECYTVRAEVRPGTQITSEMLQKMYIPASCVNDDFCMNLADIVGPAVVMGEDGKVLPAEGYYAKTTIHVGTPITKTLLMAEELQNSTREIDINVTHWPVGLTVGDYVDIRITYPMGEEFVVLSHKRVNEMNNQTLKIRMNENEMAIWNSALVEFYIYGLDSTGKGIDLYATKYIEPGVQNPAIPFYSPSINIMNVVSVNHNIEGWEKDKWPEDMNYDAAIRAIQDACMFPAHLVDPETGKNIFDVPIMSWPGLVSAGRQNLISLVNSDYDEWKATHDTSGQPDLEGDNNGGNGGSLITGGVN